MQTSEYYAVPLRQQDHKRLTEFVMGTPWSISDFIDRALEALAKQIVEPEFYMEIRTSPPLTKVVIPFESPWIPSVSNQCRIHGWTLIDVVYTAVIDALDAMEESQTRETLSQLTTAWMELPTDSVDTDMLTP